MKNYYFVAIKAAVCVLTSNICKSIKNYYFPTICTFLFAFLLCDTQAQNSNVIDMQVEVTESNINELLKNKVEAKVNEFTNRIAKLTNRQAGVAVSAEEAKATAAHTAKEIFINEDSRIQALSNGKVHTKKIEAYLWYIYGLVNGANPVYKSMSFSFSKIDIAPFKQNPNGTWSSTATIIQTFEGFTYNGERHIVSGAAGTKSIEIVAEKITKSFEGKNEPFWIIKLGNIELVNTPTK
jgi:hypothetical protein